MTHLLDLLSMFFVLAMVEAVVNMWSPLELVDRKVDTVDRGVHMEIWRL